MKTVNCEGIEYLAHEAEGNAARWIMPLAEYYCKGVGIDIGFSNREWQMPDSFGIEPDEIPGHDAMNIPDGYQTSFTANKHWDYIFSSHCLEHVKENWYNVLDYWLTKIRVGGIMFLYLPHASQNYWQPRNNRKHIHSFSGHEIGDYLKSLGHQVFVSGVDANHSFTVICQKGYAEKPKVDFEFTFRHDENVKLANRDINGNIIYGVPDKNFFEQNNIDLENRIKEIKDRNMTPPEHKSLHEHINNVRKVEGLPPLSVSEFYERVVK